MRTWELVGTAIPRWQVLRGNWPFLPGPTHIWVPPPRDGQNWGTPYGDAAGLIIPDFPGMGRACSDLGIVALVSQKKVEGWYLFGGVSHFEKNWTWYSAFWSWCAIQIFVGKLMDF